VSGCGHAGCRGYLLSGSVDEQRTQLDQLLNAQADGALGFDEVDSQGCGHLVGGREVFDGVGQEGLGVYVWADEENKALETPKATDDFSDAIFAGVDKLAQFPSIVREGRVKSTREWAVPNGSYLIPYRVRGDRLQILGIFHTRQRPRSKW
jgi:toxin ParE1/3/4